MYTVGNNQKNKTNEASVTLLDSIFVCSHQNNNIDCMLTLRYVTGVEHTLAK